MKLNLKEKIKEQKTVAIIPFDVKITYRKQPKNFNLEANREQEKAMSSNIQTSMYTFLLRKRDNYTVSFQDVEKTNILLKKAGMFDKLDQFTRDEIAKVLGVDAVIGGKFEVEQMGRGPEKIRTIIFQDLIIVRLKGFLSTSEKNLAQTKEGVDLIKKVRTALFESSREELELAVKSVLNVDVISTYSDVSTKTGEKIIGIVVDQDIDNYLANL